MEEIVMEDRKELEDDPLFKVKTHSRPFEPVDFETYRGQYEPVLEDELIKKRLKKKDERFCSDLYKMKKDSEEKNE